MCERTRGERKSMRDRGRERVPGGIKRERVATVVAVVVVVVAAAVMVGAPESDSIIYTLLLCIG